MPVYVCWCVCVCVHELYSQHIAHSAVAAQRRRVGGAAGKKSIMGKNLAKSKGRAPLEPQSWLTERPTERATERPSERRSHVCLSARRIRQQQLENVAWNLSKNSHNKCNTHTHSHTHAYKHTSLQNERKRNVAGFSLSYASNWNSDISQQQHREADVNAAPTR